MSSGKNPLMLMMALTMPGASHALGLGDIHVDSALNERLAAQIDIVGASADELDDLRAAVANRETFLRYGADRPSFLSSATFNVAHDTQGRPVLAIRSTEPFTEPLVNFLVDLRWRNGELVREYTLLLDPAGFASAVPAAPPAARPTVESKTQTVARQVEAPAVVQPDANAEPSVDRSGRKSTQIKVGPKATLRGIAWRIGERSPSDLQKMMIAIFRANPSAFDGNINRLYLGAVLTIPSEAQLAAITADAAKREVHAQMAAWRETARPALATAAIAAAPAATPTSAVTPLEAAAAATPLLSLTMAPGPADRATPAPSSAPVAASAPPTPAESPADEALDRRVHQLEQELGESKGILESKNDQLLDLQQKASRVEKPAPAEVTQVSRAQHVEPSAGHAALAPTLTGLGILAAVLAGLYFKLRRRKSKKTEETAATDSLVDTVVASAEARPLPEIQAPAPSAPPAPAWPAPESVPRMVAREPLVVSKKIPDVSDEDIALERAIEAAAIYEATHPMLPLVLDSLSLATTPEAAPAAAAPQDFTAMTATSLLPAQESTARLPLQAGAPHTEKANARMETKLDYNLVDLDMTVQHVHMPSVLNENPVIKERRTNLADVLKLAIEREPDRHDLRMKLLELYFTQASTNRNGFLEVVQKLAQDRDFRQSAEWEKIASMGRQIASDSPLFIDELAGEDDDLSVERKSA
jgi:pilus assembly protein FimV